MNNSTTDRIEKYKGAMGGKFAERASFQLERDGWMVGLVNRYTTLAAADLAALIGYAATPQGTENAYRLLARLKAAGEVQLFCQHGEHYALSVEISLRKKGAKAQFPHRALEAKRRLAMDQVVTFEEYRTGEQLRAEMAKEPIIPDGFGRIGARGWFFEDETGSHTVPEMVEKAARYNEHVTAKASDGSVRFCQLYNITEVRVVYSLKIWKQVLSLVPALRTIGDNGALFRVCHHPSTYDLRHLSRLREWPQFFSPLDDFDPKAKVPAPKRTLMEV
jgi:hypothetical protein